MAAAPPRDSRWSALPFPVRLGVVVVVAGVAGLGAGSLLRPAPVPELLPEPAEPSAPAPVPPADPLPKAVDSGIPAAMQGLAIYPDTTPAAFDAPMRTQGSELQIAWFATPDGVDAVLEFYSKDMNRDGHLVARDRYGDGAGFVVCQAPDEKDQHVVTAVPDHGRTLVFVSRGPPLQPGTAAALPVPPEVPLPATAAGALVLEPGGEAGADRVVAAQVAGQSLSEIEAFYQRTVAARGWRILRVSHPAPGAWSLDASRRGEFLQVSLLRSSDPTQAGAIQIFVRFTRDQAAQAASLFEEVAP